MDDDIIESLNDINLPITHVLQTYGEDGQTQNTYVYSIQREGLNGELYLSDGQGNASGAAGLKGNITLYATRPAAN